MEHIITAGRTTAEQAAITVARESGIKCEVVRPRRRGLDRRGYRKCLQHCSADADGSLVLGNTVPPCSADAEAVLEANKPSSRIATKVALMFPTGATDTRAWIRNHKIKKLHVTGTAPKAMAAKFLRTVLAGKGSK